MNFLPRLRLHTPLPPCWMLWRYLSNSAAISYCSCSSSSITWHGRPLFDYHDQAEVAFVPLQPPEAAHDTAFVDDQLSVTDEPATTSVAPDDRVTVGGEELAFEPLPFPPPPQAGRPRSTIAAHRPKILRVVGCFGCFLDADGCVLLDPIVAVLLPRLPASLWRTHGTPPKRRLRSLQTDVNMRVNAQLQHRRIFGPQ